MIASEIIGSVQYELGFDSREDTKSSKNNMRNLLWLKKCIPSAVWQQNDLGRSLLSEFGF